jgi:hypothetical protein
VKSTTPVDEYKCPLDQELINIARDELRETEQIRVHAIRAIREWVMENPRIVKCRLDANFILAFLRWRKFSITRAQEVIERYLVYREGFYGEDWFSNLDPLRPSVLTLLERGLIVPLPKPDKMGRTVLLLNYAQLDPSLEDIGNAFLSLMTSVLIILMLNEENHVRGLHYICDFKGTHLKQATIFPIELWYKYGKNMEVCCL